MVSLPSHGCDPLIPTCRESHPCLPGPSQSKMTDKSVFGTYSVVIPPLGCSGSNTEVQLGLGPRALTLLYMDAGFLVSSLIASDSWKDLYHPTSPSRAWISLSWAPTGWWGQLPDTHLLDAIDFAANFLRIACSASHCYCSSLPLGILCYVVYVISSHSPLNWALCFLQLPQILQQLCGCKLAFYVYAFFFFFFGSTWCWVCPLFRVPSLLIWLYVTYHPSPIPDLWPFCKTHIFYLEPESHSSILHVCTHNSLLCFLFISFFIAFNRTSSHICWVGRTAAWVRPRVA